MADPDWTDPCAVLTWLRPQYYQLVAGGQAIKVKRGERETTFTQADATQVKALMLELQDECAARQGTTRRRAFTAG